MPDWFTDQRLVTSQTNKKVPWKLKTNLMKAVGLAILDSWKQSSKKQRPSVNLKNGSGKLSEKSWFFRELKSDLGLLHRLLCRLSPRFFKPTSFSTIKVWRLKYQDVQKVFSKTAGRKKFREVRRTFLFTGLTGVIKLPNNNNKLKLRRSNTRLNNVLWLIY